jgi:hypothetical protein
LFHRDPQRNSTLNHITKINEVKDLKTREEIYFHLTAIFNLIEGKNNKPDAIRKWTQDRIKIIIQALNGDPPSASFDQELLQYLFEIAYGSKQT